MDASTSMECSDRARPSSITSSFEEYDPYFVEMLSDENLVREASFNFNPLIAGLPQSLRSKIRADTSHDPLSHTAGNEDTQPFLNIKAPSTYFEHILHTFLDFLNSNNKSTTHEAEEEDATRILGSMSRDELWAVAFTEKGVLDYYLDSLQSADNKNEQRIDGSLKIIANCCTRSIRTKTSTFPRLPIASLVERLMQKASAPLTTKAICAITNGNDEAIRQLEQMHRLTSRLLEGVANKFYEESDIDILLDIIEETTAYVDSTKLDDRHLLALAEIPVYYSVSRDRLSILANFLLHILPKDPQSIISISVYVRTVLLVFASTFSMNDRQLLLHGMLDVALIVATSEQLDDETLARLRTNLISSCDKTTMMIQDIRNVQSELTLLTDWIRLPIGQAQIFGCVILGNLAYRHQGLVEELINQFDICGSLKVCIENGKDHGVLMSAFDLLQNIAKSQGRELLGKAGLLTSLERHWKTTTIFSGKALYHTRQLLHDSPLNCALFVSDETSKATQVPGRSLFSRLLDMYSHAEDSTIRAEVGKVVAEIWRTLEARSRHKSIDSTTDRTPKPDRSIQEGSESSSLDLESKVSTKTDGKEATYIDAVSKAAPSKMGFIEEDELQPRNGVPSSTILLRGRTNQVIEPIIGLVKSDNETLRSQGWFTLSLMSQRSEGANAVYEACIDKKDTYVLLENTLLEPQTHPALRSNAQYLVAILHEHFKEDPQRIQVLEKLAPQKVRGS